MKQIRLKNLSFGLRQIGSRTKYGPITSPRRGSLVKKLYRFLDKTYNKNKYKKAIGNIIFMIRILDNYIEKKKLIKNKCHIVKEKNKIKILILFFLLFLMHASWRSYKNKPNIQLTEKISVVIKEKLINQRHFNNFSSMLLTAPKTLIPENKRLKTTDNSKLLKITKGHPGLILVSKNKEDFINILAHMFPNNNENLLYLRELYKKNALLVGHITHGSFGKSLNLITQSNRKNYTMMRNIFGKYPKITASTYENYMLNDETVVKDIFDNLISYNKLNDFFSFNLTKFPQFSAVSHLFYIEAMSNIINFLENSVTQENIMSLKNNNLKKNVELKLLLNKKALHLDLKEILLIKKATTNNIKINFEKTNEVILFDSNILNTITIYKKKQNSLIIVVNTYKETERSKLYHINQEKEKLIFQYPNLIFKKKSIVKMYEYDVTTSIFQLELKKKNNIEDYLPGTHIIKKILDII